MKLMNTPAQHKAIIVIRTALAVTPEKQIYRQANATHESKIFFIFIFFFIKNIDHRSDRAIFPPGVFSSRQIPGDFYASKKQK